MSVGIPRSRLLKTVRIATLAIVPGLSCAQGLPGISPVAAAAEGARSAPRIRVPSPAWVHPGDLLTGSVASPDGSRPANGLIRIGDLEITVRDGRFRIESAPAGRHIVRLFHETGTGAELARVVLVVPDRPRPAAQRQHTIPGMVLPAGSLLVRGPFEDACESVELLVEGSSARLLWGSSAACLFHYSVDGHGVTPVVLRGGGKVIADGNVHVVRVRWIGPEPDTVSARSDEIRFAAEVSGLPEPDDDQPRGEPMLEVRYRSLDPSVATSLRSKSPKSHTGEDGVLVLPILAKMISPGEPVTVKGIAGGRAKGAVRIEGRLVIPSRFSGSHRPLEAGTR